MKLSTSLLTLLALVLLGTSAHAQKSITFEYDMQSLLDLCQFDPDGDDFIALRGSFNGWNEAGQDTLRATGNGAIYAATVSLAEGEALQYKLFLGNATDAGWEDGLDTGSGNREYTVTADETQTVTVAPAYNKTLENICNATTAKVAITFQVNMDTQIRAANFDPSDPDNVVTVAGAFQGWDNKADTLAADFFDQNLYSKTFYFDAATIPYGTEFKFVLQPGDGWESISPNRTFTISEEQLAAATDNDNDGYLDFVADPSPGETTAEDYFNYQTPDELLSQEVTLNLEVDMRPAFYFLADSSALPNTTADLSAETIASLGVFVNGPIRGGWADWGPNFLGQSTVDGLRDDGQGGDAVAGDSVYTWQTTFAVNKPKGPYAFKFGVGGYDNEAGFGVDHSEALSDEAATQTIALVYGAVPRADGSVYTELYAPYIAVDAQGNVSVQRRPPPPTSEVTFEYDMQSLLDLCQFDPDGDDYIALRGSFNGWNEAGQDTLRATGNGAIYATTVTIEQGQALQYKLFLGNATEAGWEDGLDTGSGNREYTVTADETQTVTVAPAYNKTLENICNATTAKVAITFQVNMDTQIRAANFDPSDPDNVVTVAGAFQGWDNKADTLAADFFDQNLYSKTFYFDAATIPYGTEFKFVLQPGDGWESISPNRTFTISEEQLAAATDNDNDGYLDFVADPSPGETTAEDYFNYQTPDELLSQEVTLNLEVDMRPAFYFLADSSALPNTTADLSAETIASLGVFVNGPIRGGWADWGPNFLGQSTVDGLRDDGQGGDAVAGDSVYTWQTTFAVNKPKGPYAFKFGVGGYDNEAGFGVDHSEALSDEAATQTIALVYGAVPRADGSVYTELYAPYIAVDAQGNVSVQRRPSTGTPLEEVGLPTGFGLEANYPNPFTNETTIAYSIEQAETVRLRVYDVTGRVVATLVNGVQPAASYRVTFDASGLAAGVYVYRLETASDTLTQKMLLVK